MSPLHVLGAIFVLSLCSCPLRRFFVVSPILSSILSYPTLSSCLSYPILFNQLLFFVFLVSVLALLFIFVFMGIGPPSSSRCCAYRTIQNFSISLLSNLFSLSSISSSLYCVVLLYPLCLVAISLLGGCAGMSVGEKESCGVVPTGATCVSAKDVYLMTNQLKCFAESIF